LLILTAKICGLSPFIYSPRDPRSADVVESIGGEKASTAADFKLFLKKIVLCGAGFSEPIIATPQDMALHGAPSNAFTQTNQVIFERKCAAKVMMIINSAQQMTKDDRRLLLQIVDRQDPSALFDDQEIQGLYSGYLTICEIITSFVLLLQAWEIACEEF
jgi:hypothetical protein